MKKDLGREAIPTGPLTPALSPSEGERENRCQSVEISSTSGILEGRPLPPPLPFGRGEGRGEGSRGDGLRRRTIRHALAAAGFLLSLATASAGEEWPAALEQMPLPPGTHELNRSNCVALMLSALQSNQVVKALVFMPGATDEFYMFRRATARLTQPSPTLLDTVAALTNQTLIRATFRPPLLLLHTEEDIVEPLAVVEDEKTAAKLHRARFVPHGLFNDRDWDALQPVLKKALKVDMRPWRYRFDSWHFYRHSFASWGLNGWEALEVAALAGRTKFTVRRNCVVFAVDGRARKTPKFDTFPR